MQHLVLYCLIGLTALQLDLPGTPALQQAPWARMAHNNALPGKSDVA